MMLPKFKCFTTLVFLLLNQNVISLSARLNIERGDQDVFDNPNCKNPTGDGCNCNGLNAYCANTCRRCKCLYANKTFLSTNDNNGQCVKDRRLLFIPTFLNQSFSPQNIKSKKCMKAEWHSKHDSYRAREIKCHQNNSKQRWIWTQYNQLMHVDTLKCLQESAFTYGIYLNYYHLVLDECMSTEKKQLWQCLNNVNFQSKKSMLYMYQSNKWNYIYGTTSVSYSEDQKWRRYPSIAENLCSKSFGCYEFVKDSPVILVTDVKNCSKQCLEEKEISVPHKSGENLCFVIWDKLQYLDNGEWKRLHFRDEIFTIDKSDTRTFLKLNFTKTTNDSWTGLIVKLDFYCAGGKLAQVKVNTTNTKCVVIKFKGTLFYPPTVSSMVPTIQKVTTTLSTNDSSTAPSTVNATDTIPNATDAAENYKSDSSPVVLISVVCVVIAILILCGILGFIFYRRRRRSVTTVVHKEGDLPADAQQSEVTMNSIYSTADDKPTPFFSGNDETNQEPQTGASRECDLYELGDNNVYESADVEQNDKRHPPQDHAYDYANSDDVRHIEKTSLVGVQSYDHLMRDTHSGGKDARPVYETLEDPSVDAN